MGLLNFCLDDLMHHGATKKIFKFYKRHRLKSGGSEVKFKGL